MGRCSIGLRIFSVRGVFICPVIDENEQHFRVEVAGPPADVDATIVELRRSTVLREAPHVVVDRNIVDRTECITELNAPNLVRLAEGLVKQKR